MRQALIARGRCWLLATALSCVPSVQADEAPPEGRDRPLAPVASTAQQSERDQVRDDPRREAAATLGFNLPPMLEELMDRLEDGLRQDPEAADTVSPVTALPAAPRNADTDQASAASTDATAGHEPEATDSPSVDPEPAVRGANDAASEQDVGVAADRPGKPGDSDAALVDADDLGPQSGGGDDETLATQADDMPAAENPPDISVDDVVDDVTAGAVQGPRPGTPDDPSHWGPPPPDPAANAFGAVPITLLGGEIKPGNRERLHWTTGQSFSGSVMETPVVVVHGQRRGPRLCLTGGVHGDELNGIEVVRRLAYRVEPQTLAGTVIAVPIVNLLGFSRGSRYLPDRRDLNRFFPGSLHGSSASRIANSFFESIIIHCDALVDVHTGSLDRANLPQVRGDLTNPAVLDFTRGFGATAVLHSPGTMGMLRHAASMRGIPSVTFEIGAPLRLQPEEIEHGVQAIETLLNKMGMIEQRRRWREPQAVFYESRWVRVDHGGMLFSDVALGDRVQRGQRLGRVIDPVSNRGADVVSNDSGRIIGMALNQLVLPGFAAYNLGIAASEEQVVTEAALDAAPDDERFLENDQLDEDQRLLEDGDRVPDEAMGNGRRREGDGGRH